MSEVINTAKGTINKYYNQLIIKNKNNKLFNKYDEILIKKCFSYIHDLSETESILNIKTLALKPGDIKNIVECFITYKKTTKTDIYNILRISNLARFRIEHSINEEDLLKIGKKVASVSHETSSICIDFELLRVMDNFISRSKTAHLKNYFNSIRKDILRKIMRFDYKEIIEERRVNYLYWINRILEAFLQEDLTVYEFVDFNKKIMYLLPDFMDLHWEIIRIANFLYFHPKYCCSSVLRRFRRNMIKIIKTKYNPIAINKDYVLNALFNTLSQQPVNKESFYYLFDLIKILSEKSTEDKLFCFNLLEYLVYRDERQNIFCYRFIREMFLKMLENILKKDDDYRIKEREFYLIFILSENENFSYFYNEKISNFINFLMDSVSQQNNNTSYKKIKKYYKCLCLLKDEKYYNDKAFILS